jgi:hypothetical protein
VLNECSIDTFQIENKFEDILDEKSTIFEHDPLLNDNILVQSSSPSEHTINSHAYENTIVSDCFLNQTDRWTRQFNRIRYHQSKQEALKQKILI